MKYLGNPQSGSQAQTTASRNSFGQYFRTRAIPVNPRTELQTKVRETFGGLASAWTVLTDTQRAAWEVCARKFPKVDSLGQTVVLSGFQQFIRSNTAMNQTGQGSQLEPKPDTYFSNAAIVPTVKAGTTPKFEFTYQPSNPGQFLVVDVSPQVRPGISYFTDYRNLAIQPSNGTSPAEELGKYQATFGALMPGMKIFFRSRVLNECGVYGPEFTTTTIVGPPPVALVALNKSKKEIAAGKDRS